MRKIGELDPFSLLMLVLLVLCAGALTFEGVRRLQPPAQRAVAPASASAPAPAPKEQPKPEAPAEQPGSGGIYVN